jgi:hypothetical protein
MLAFALTTVLLLHPQGSHHMATPPPGAYAAEAAALDAVPAPAPAVVVAPQRKTGFSSLSRVLLLAIPAWGGLVLVTRRNRRRVE